MTAVDEASEHEGTVDSVKKGHTLGANPGYEPFYLLAMGKLIILVELKIYFL